MQLGPEGATEAVHNRKPETQTLVLLTGCVADLIKLAKNGVLMFGGDTDAAVANLKAQTPALTADTDQNAPAWRGVPDLPRLRLVQAG